MYKQVSEELLSLIQQSPSCFHAVRTISALLEEAGYTQLNECDSWKLEKGGKYYTTRNGSSVIAFAIGEELDDYHFQLTSSHSDSPTFKVKERRTERQRRISAAEYRRVWRHALRDLDGPSAFHRRSCARQRRKCARQQAAFL
ncbi:MAG: hypothetical protein ACLTCB_05095 [Merdibacter sp.]